MDYKISLKYFASVGSSARIAVAAAGRGRQRGKGDAMCPLCFTLFCYFRIIYWPRDEQRRLPGQLKCTAEGYAEGEGNRGSVGGGVAWANV